MKLAVVTDQPTLLGWPALPVCLKLYLWANCINSLLVQALMHNCTCNSDTAVKLAVVTDQPPLLCLNVYLWATCINSLLVQALMHMQLWYSRETCGRKWPTTPSRLTCFTSVCLCALCSYLISLKVYMKNSPATVSDIMQLEYMQHNLFRCIKYWQDVQNRAPLGQLHQFP